MKLSLITATLAVLASLSSCEKIDPGLKFSVNQGALDYVTETILPVVLQELQKVEIESITTDVSTPIGTVVLEVTDIKFTDLNAGTIDVSFVSPHSIKATVSGASASVTFGWRYRQKIWPHTSDRGTGEATARKVSALVSMEVRTNSTDGRPIVRAPRIKFKIGKLKVKLHGGASWLYNIFITVLKPFIVGNIDKAVKNELRYLLNVFVNDELARFPVQIPLGLGIGIAYRLTADPTVTHDRSLVVPSQAEFFPLELGTGHSGHAPAKLPDRGTSRVNMFEFVFSAFTLQTLGFSAYKARALEQRLTKEKAAGIPGAGVLFTTDVYAVYAPRMLTKYGRGKEVSLRFSALREPEVSLIRSGFNVTFPMVIHVDVRVVDKAANTSRWEEAFAITAFANAHGSVGFENNTLHGKVTLVNSTIGLYSSNVGAVNVRGLSSTIHLALDVAQTIVNRILHNGVPVPSVQGLTFVDPIIEWYNDYFAISTSGKYVPPVVPDRKQKSINP